MIQNQHPLRRAARRVALGLAVCASVIALAACDSDDDGAPTPSVTATATATAGDATATATPVTGGGGGDAPHDVDRAACDDLAPDVRAAFPDAPLIEDVSGYSVGDGSVVGQGCRILLVGTQDQMPEYADLVAGLRAVLEANGWIEDPQLAADGPGATMSVYTDASGRLAVFAASMGPRDPSACPTDQPIASCLEALAPQEVTVQAGIILSVED